MSKVRILIYGDSNTYGADEGWLYFDAENHCKMAEAMACWVKSIDNKGRCE